MIFCEPVFLFVFLPALLAAYYAAPERAKNPLLASASLLFYALGEWRFLGWLIASVALNYWIAIGIDRYRNRPWAFRLLVIGVASDLALLVVFKYAGFIAINLNRVLAWTDAAPVSVPQLLLPLGISFFTFHKISYKVDVYRGVAEARRQPLDLALYILLFPQLVAGPIVRYNEIARELVTRVVTRVDLAAGIRRFTIGLGKKMIVANTVAYPADQIFGLPTSDLTMGLAWLGVVCYSLQIYFDFSGYSDMAIGLARMFGFHFPENFNYPYIANSVTDFWRRWHMSLSRWFRDYLYIPLGGNRATPARTYVNLVVVFLLCGFWHGASWGFVVWGLFHGVLLVVERLGLASLLARMPRAIAHGYTLFAILVGWALFRGGTLHQSADIIAAMVGFGQGDGLAVNVELFLTMDLLLIGFAGMIGSMPLRGTVVRIFDRLRTRTGGRASTTVDATFHTAWHAAVLGYSLLLIAAQTYNPFIYFRF